MADRKPVDWERIERDYRAGQLSVSEIARQNGISEGAVRKRAKKYGWERDLSDRVRQAVRNAVVRSAVRETAPHEVVSDDEIVAVAKARGTKAIEGHLARAERLKRLTDKKLDLLDAYYGDDPEKRAEAAERLFPTKGDSLTSSERTVADVAERIAKLERQALNIDDTPGDGDVTQTLVIHGGLPDPEPAGA